MKNEKDNFPTKSLEEIIIKHKQQQIEHLTNSYCKWMKWKSKNKKTVNSRR